jgi:cytochrome bd ubiquinol oxidase subunit I
VEIVYYAYHIMVGLGTIFIAVSALRVPAVARPAVRLARHALWILMLAMPFPYIANQAGWVVAEVGRQPWVVYGLQRTADATSTQRDRRDDLLHADSASWGSTRWSGSSTCSFRAS